MFPALHSHFVIPVSSHRQLVIAFSHGAKEVRSLASTSGWFGAAWTAKVAVKMRARAASMVEDGCTGNGVGGCVKFYAWGGGTLFVGRHI